jgi:hypothetical protein
MDIKPVFEITNGTIEVYKKNNYGTEHLYIKNPDIRRVISGLTGTATINGYVDTLKRLGFTLKLVLEGEDKL